MIVREIEIRINDEHFAYYNADDYEFGIHGAIEAAMEDLWGINQDTYIEEDESEETANDD